MTVSELIKELEKIKDKEKIVHVDCIGIPLHKVEEVEFYNEYSDVEEEAVILY